MPEIKGFVESSAPAGPMQGFRPSYISDIGDWRPERTVLGSLGDVGVTALKGAVGLPAAFVGLADIPTGGRVGRALEGLGYRPEETQQILDTWYSDAQQEANRRVAQAEGFVGKAQTALQNPSTIFTAAGESVPLMLGGAGIARGLLRAAPKVAPWAAAAVGEGTIGAGAAASQIRSQTEDGLLTPGQSGAALASGVGTGLLGAVGGRAAQRLGLGDIDTALAQGAAGAGRKGLLRNIGGSALSEGVFEELPQSMQEQAWQNAALGKPLMEGVPEAGAMGMLAGGLMGGGFGAYNNRAMEADLLRREEQLAEQERIRGIARQEQQRQLLEDQQLGDILDVRRRLSPALGQFGLLAPGDDVSAQGLIDQQLGISPAQTDKELERQRKQREADILAAFNEPSGVRVAGEDGQERELSAIEASLMQQGLLQEPDAQATAATPATQAPTEAPAAPAPAPAATVFTPQQQDLINRGVNPTPASLSLWEQAQASVLSENELDTVANELAKNYGAGKKALQSILVARNKPAPVVPASSAVPAAPPAPTPGATSLPIQETAANVQASQAVQAEAQTEAPLAATTAQGAPAADAPEPVIEGEAQAATAALAASPTPPDPVIQRKGKRVVDAATLQQSQAFVAPEVVEEQATSEPTDESDWEDSKPDGAPALTALTPSLQQVWSEARAAKAQGRRINLFKVAEDITAEQGEEVSDDDTMATLNQIFGERDAAMLYDRYVENMTEEAIANKYGQSRQNVAKVTGEGKTGAKTRAAKIKAAQKKFGWTDEYVQQLANKLSPSEQSIEVDSTDGRTAAGPGSDDVSFGGQSALAGDEFSSYGSVETASRDPSLREAGFSTSASLGGSVSNWRDSGELAGRQDITQADQSKLDDLHARRTAAEEAGDDSTVESTDAEISMIEARYLRPEELSAKYTQRAMDLLDKAGKRRQQIEQARAAGKAEASINNKLVPIDQLEAEEATLRTKAQQAMEEAEAVLLRGAVRKAKGADPKAEAPKVRRVKKAEAQAPPAAAAQSTEALTPTEQASKAWDQATNTIPGAPKWADLTSAQQREFVGYGEGNWTRQDVVTMLQRAAPSNAKFGKDSKAKGRATYTAKELIDDIKAFIRADVLGRKLVIVDTIGDLLNSSDRTRRIVGAKMALERAYGVAANGTGYLVADRIRKGSGRAKFMHEVGVHLGLENLLPKAVYDRLTQQIVDWARADDSSLESEIALDAVERTRDANTKPEDRRAEILAYFVEVAMERGIDPTADVMQGSKGLREWFRTLWAAFKAAVRRLGMKPESLAAQDVVNLAFGAARLEIAGTWHGTAASFRRFDHKFMNTGEGAQAYGWGTYLAQRFGIARGYWVDDVKRKTTAEKVIVRYDGVAVEDMSTDFDGDVTLNGLVVSVTQQLQRGGKTVQQAIDAVVTDLEKRVASVQRSVDSARRNRLPGLPDLLESLEFNKADLAAAKALDPAKFEVINQKRYTPDGSLMRVDTSVADDEFLDWDKPLTEQSEKVRKALREAGRSYGSDDASARGRDLYEDLLDEFGEDKEDVSKYLESIGINGIKFLDARSRGTANRAVRFEGQEYNRDDLRDKLREARGTNDQDERLALNVLKDVLRDGMEYTEDDLSRRTKDMEDMYFDIYRSAAQRYGTKWDEASERAKAELEASVTPQGKKLEWLRKNKDAIDLIELPRTQNLVIFNDKNIFRVGAQAAADKQRMRFGKDLREKLPAELQKPVGAITSVLNDTKNAALNTLTFTEDVMNRAIDLGVKSASRLRTIYQERAALAGKLEREVERVADLYNRVPERERGTGPASVNQFLYDATREGKWGFKPAWRTGASAKVSVDADMQRRFNALSKESKTLVEAVFRHGDEVLSLKKQTVIDATNSEYDALIAAANKVGDTKKAASLTADKTDQLKRFSSLFELQAFKPYAPLRRFGNYVVIARSQAYLDADDKTQRQLEKSEDHYHVSFAESAAAARELVDQLNKQGAFAEVVFREKEAVQQTMYGGTLTAFNKLRSELDSELADAAPGEKAALRAARKAVGELYLSTLAENSARKSEMRRRGVAGEIDVLRSFTTQGRADAQFIAGAKYNGQTLEAFNAMRREVKSGDAEAQNTKSGVFNELMKRHTQSLNYDPSPIASKLARLTSVWFLATSPAYYLQNLTQPFMMSMPVMAGRHNYLKVGNALMRAYSDLAPMFRSAKLGEQFNYGVAPPDVRSAISTLVDRGRIDIGMDTDLGNFQIEGQGAVKDRWNKVDRGIRNVAQKMEAVNRLATAIAAYRIELAKTGDTAAALEYADSIISQTHGDYTALNAPRAFNTATGKVALQFRKFQLIQLTLLAKLVKNSFSGPDRAAARAALGFTLGHTAVMAGAIGLPGFAAISWALGALMGGGDDDEPFNLEQWLREQTGNDRLSTLITRGAPAALGVDLSQKLGMGNVLSLLPFNELDLSARSGVESAAFAAFGGPAGGLTLRALDGLSLIRDGEYYKGLEQLMPTGVTNAMKAYRVANEGVTRRNGDVLISDEDISGMDAFWQAIGFQPTRISERTFREGVKRDAEDRFRTRAQKIRSAYLRARGDAEARAEARQQWMRLQDVRAAAGFRRQPLSALLRSEQSQRERERDTMGGIQFNRDNRRFVEDLVTEEE